MCNHTLEHTVGIPAVAAPSGHMQVATCISTECLYIDQWAGHGFTAADTAAYAAYGTLMVEMYRHRTSATGSDGDIRVPAASTSKAFRGTL